MSWYEKRKGDLRMGKLYGIGVGPGDPELLTLKAHRILGEADVIFCPEKKKGAGSFAYDIIKGLLKDAGVEIVNLVYPMHSHGDRLQEMWKENAAQIEQDWGFYHPGRSGCLQHIHVYTALYRTGRCGCGGGAGHHLFLCGG